MHVRVYYRHPKPDIEGRSKILIHRYDDVNLVRYGDHGVFINIDEPEGEQIFIPYDNIIELQKWE